MALAGGGADVHQPCPAFLAHMKAYQSLRQLGWSRQRGRQLSMFGTSAWAEPGVELRVILRARSLLDEFAAMRAHTATGAGP